MEENKNTTKELAATLAENINKQKYLEEKILKKEVEMVACLKLLNKSERKNTKLVRR